MGPFNTNLHGNRYIILAIDHFTKFAEGAATVTFDGVTTAVFLFHNIICRYGMIEKLLSNQWLIKFSLVDWNGMILTNGDDILIET